MSAASRKESRTKRPSRRDDPEAQAQPPREPRGPPTQHLRQKLAQAVKGFVFYPIDRPDGMQARAVSLATLQRGRLHALQLKLAQALKDMGGGDGTLNVTNDDQFDLPSDVDELLHAYFKSPRSRPRLHR